MAPPRRRPAASIRAASEVVGELADDLGELAEGEDLAEGARVVVEDEGAVGRLGGEDEVGVLDHRRRERAAEEPSLAMPRGSRVAAITASMGCSRKPWVPALVKTTSASGPARWRAVSSMKGERQMLAVQTKRTRMGSGSTGAAAGVSWLGWSLRTSTTGALGRFAPQHTGVEVEVAGVPEGLEDVVEGVVDGAAGGVDADVGVLGLLVGGGDAGELGDLAGAGLGVEALAVAALALLERRGHVDEEEGAAGVLDHLPHLLAGLVERRDRAADRDAAVAGDLGRHPADAADVGLAVGLGEGEAGREVAAYDVAVEAGQGAVARSRTRSIRAWARVDLPLPERPVKKTTSPWSAGVWPVALDHCGA